MSSSRIGKACKLCRTKKRRCSGGDPCRRCFLAKEECLYGTPIKRAKSDKKFNLNLASGSIEDIFKKFETVLPLESTNSTVLPIIATVRVIPDEVFNLIMTLDRSSLIANVTKYLYCGYMSYDADELNDRFGTAKIFTKDEVTPLCIIVLAIGTLYKPNVTTQDFQIALTLYSSCSNLMAYFYGNISLDNAEVLALNSWFLRAINEKKSSMVISSMSIQIATMMGLYALNESMEESDPLYDRKKKVWWSIYSINRFFAVRSGFPVYLDQNLITTPYPRWNNLPENDTILNRKTYDLALIAEDINDLYINRKLTPSINIIDKILSLIQRLIKWKESSPFYSEQKNLSRSLSSVNLNHSHLIQLTTIPVLLHLTIQKLSGEKIHIKNLTSRMASIISICQKSGLLSINILTHMSKDSIANFGVFDIEYLSTSSLIICMISVLNMDTEAFTTLNTAIELLEHIKKFGSPHAFEHHIKLVKFLNETKKFIEKNVPNTPPSSSNSIETYSIPQDTFSNPQNDSLSSQDDLKLWQTIYNGISLDINSNWEEFINFL